MVVPVRVPADPFALPVLLEFIPAEFLEGVRRALPVDHDGPVLQPFHPVFHAARPLDGLLRFDAQAAVVRDALLLGAVAGGELFVVPVVEDPFRGLLVAHPVPVVFVQQIDGLPGLVIVQADERILVREPAPVHALIDVVKLPEFIVADRPQLEVFEHVSAEAHRDAQILVLIPLFVPLFQLLRLLEKGLSQPLPVTLVQAEIRARVLDAVLPLLQAVPVRPVVLRAGRVAALEVPEQLSAAHGGLQDAVDLRAAGKLVLFLEVRDADIAELRLDALDLRRVVRAAKQDSLPRRLEDQLERRFFRFPQLADAQLVDGPFVLGIYRVLQRPGHLPQDQGVHCRVQHHKRHHRQRHPA